MVGKLLLPVNMDVYYQKVLTKYNSSNYTIFFFRRSRMPTCPTSMLQFLQRGTQFELSQIEIIQEALYFRLL